MVSVLMQFGLYWEKASISDVFITVKKTISNAASLLKPFNGQCNIICCLHHPIALMYEAIYHTQ